MTTYATNKEREVGLAMTTGGSGVIRLPIRWVGGYQQRGHDCERESNKQRVIGLASERE